MTLGHAFFKSTPARAVAQEVGVGGEHGRQEVEHGSDDGRTAQVFVHGEPDGARRLFRHREAAKCGL